MRLKQGSARQRGRGEYRHGEAGGPEGKYDWEKKRLEVYNDVSAHLRASWCRRAPGGELFSYDDAKAFPETVPKLGEAKTDEDKRNQEESLRNFALLIIEPLEVDWVQLGTSPDRRTRFTRKEVEGDGDEWIEKILVP